MTPTKVWFLRPNNFWGSKKFLGPSKIEKNDFRKKPKFCYLSKNWGWFPQWPWWPRCHRTSWDNSSNLKMAPAHCEHAKKSCDNFKILGRYLHFAIYVCLSVDCIQAGPYTFGPRVPQFWRQFFWCFSTWKNWDLALWNIFWSLGCVKKAKNVK